MAKKEKQNIIFDLDDTLGSNLKPLKVENSMHLIWPPQSSQCQLCKVDDEQNYKKMHTFMKY